MRSLSQSIFGLRYLILNLLKNELECRTTIVILNTVYELYCV